MATVKKIAPKKIVKKVVKKIAKINSPKENMILALTKALGVVSTACLKAGICRKSHYDWMIADPVYNAQVMDIKNIAIDFVESKMFGQINNGDAGLIKYYLGTQGRNRGYVEKTETDIRITKVGMDIEEEVYE